MDDSKSTATATETAACCANFYEQDWVQEILGESFHPGGPDLSARLIHSLNLPVDARVVDVACGIGTTSLMMARQFCLEPVGIDFSQANVDKALESAGTTPVVLAEFFQGAAENLPLEDESCDALVCECAVSTFTDQPKVLKEFYRVLKPGGVVGISDMVVAGELPEDIAKSIAPWTCMAQARTPIGYQQLFLDAGFLANHYADESHTLLELISDLKKKLLMASVGKTLGMLPGVPLDLKDIRRLLGQAKELTEAGTVQYCRLLFSKGAPNHPLPALTPAPLAKLDCDGSKDCC